MKISVKELIYYKCEYCSFESDRISEMEKHEEMHIYTKGFKTGDKVMVFTGEYVEKHPVERTTWKPMNKLATVLETDVESYKMLVELEDGTQEWAFSFNVNRS